MRKQIESNRKPGDDLYRKTKEQEEQDKKRRTLLGRK